MLVEQTLITEDCLDELESHHLTCWGMTSILSEFDIITCR